MWRRNRAVICQKYWFWGSLDWMNADHPLDPFAEDLIDLWRCAGDYRARPQPGMGKNPICDILCASRCPGTRRYHSSDVPGVVEGTRSLSQPSA